jgi:hypothetical protein
LVSLSAELESLQYGLMGLALPAVAATTAIAAISTATTIATATAVATTAAATTATFTGSGFVDTDHAPHPFDVLKVVNSLLFGRIVG